jgi:glutathione synthase
MRIGIVVNVMAGDESGATTYRIAAEAVSRGHEVWVMSTGGFSYEPDNHVGSLARRVPEGRYDSARFLKSLRKKQAVERWITLDDLDVLVLRSNPSVQSAWAQSAGIHFGRLALRRGVLVLNDPEGLSRAMNKLYLQTFPESVRPRTLVARHPDRIKEYLLKEGTLILKPLQGSGGKGVFIVRRDSMDNVDDVIKAVTRDGYVMAQEYLPAAAEGDTRLFLMNGVPLRHEGKYAAFRRIRSGDDVRSNIHAGGKLRRAEVDDEMLRLAEAVRARLVEDGMFFVGLDIVGDKLLEINVFSPGGLGSAQMFEKVNFNEAVVDAMERKVEYVKSCRRDFSNVALATL